MNCVEFRRRLLIEPRSQDKEFISHAASCLECAGEERQALRFEDRLRAALDVPRPGGLESRIVEVRSRTPERILPELNSRWLALAAGMLMAIALTGWLGYKWEHYFSVTSGLQMAVIHHINEELDHLHADQHVESERLGYLLLQFGAGINGDVGRINFVSRCNIRRHSGVHMVVPGRQGPVTVLIMPGEHRMKREQVSSARFSGVIVPTGYGSMAVVGEKLESVEQIIEKMKQIIVWGA